MRRCSLHCYFEPIDTSVPKAHTIVAERLSNYHIVDALAGQETLLTKISDSSESAALLVHSSALFNRAHKLKSASAYSLNRENRSCNSCLLVCYSTTIYSPVAHGSGKRVYGPTLSWWNHVDVPVEMQKRVAQGPQPSDNVDTRVKSRAFGQSLCFYVIDFVSESPKLVSNEGSAFAIVGARWIYGGNSDKLLNEREKFVLHFVDAIENDAFLPGQHRLQAGKPARRVFSTAFENASISLSVV